MNFLRDIEDDIIITEADGFSFGNTDIDDVSLLLRLSPGNLKHSPLTGCGLTRFVKGAVPVEQVESIVARQLKMDGKDYKEVQKLIKVG